MRIGVGMAAGLFAACVLVSAHAAGRGAQAPAGVTELKGLMPLAVGGRPVPKRYVVRHPAPGEWNGSLVVGAHGGSGGSNYDPAGNVIGTDETALDDVIGRYALSRGFAYASVDRDGLAGSREALALTVQFTRAVRQELTTRLGSAPRRTLVVGLSMGGGIARFAAEAADGPYDGALIIAGANGDLLTRQARQSTLAELWPAVDPTRNPGLALDDPRVRAYADAIGTPPEARRLWPYTARGLASNRSVTGEDSTGRLQIPTIEVVGTWDDLVIQEIRAYERKVRPRDRHRLYQVEGVWHMSSDDDGVQSFQFIATKKLGLDPDVAKAMGEGPSYLPTVRQAFDLLVEWVEKGTAPPASRMVKPGGRIE